MFSYHRFVAVAVPRASVLSMSSLIPKKVIPGIIIGAGRIGNHLYKANGQQDLLLTRNDPFPQKLNTCPIYVCVRNDDLEKVIYNVPISHRSDMIFVQNGIIEPILRKYYIDDCSTQALIYYGIAKNGDTPIDGKTDVNPERLTAVTGKWSHDFKNRLANTGLACHIKDRQTFQVAMLEKHIWICSFMLIGVKYQICVGDVEKYHRQEVLALMNELATLIAAEYQITFPDNMEARLCAYARAVAAYPTALKEFQWRNGWVTQLTQHYSQDPCPVHSQLLREIRMHQ